MTDKQVDTFLIYIEKSDYKVTLFNKNIDIENFDAEKVVKTLNKSFQIKYLVEELKLIRYLQEIGETDLYGLTKKGRKVVRIGGWLKYIERKDKIEKKKELKEDYELKIVEFQAKNPRLPYYLAMGSFIIAILSFINSCNSEKEKKQNKIETIERIEELPYLHNNNSEDTTKVLQKK